MSLQMLKSKGFKAERATGVYLLRIQNEFMDRKTGRIKMSNIRTEITSLSNIKSYCKKNAFCLRCTTSHIQNFIKNVPKLLMVNESSPCQLR